MTDGLLDSLRRAVGRAPADAVLRLHLADLLVAAGLPDEAIEHLSVILQAHPGAVEARDLMARALSTDGGDEPDLDGFDWRAAESQLRDLDLPRFEPHTGAPLADPVRPPDLGSLAAIKRRLEAAFLIPLGDPERQRADRRPAGGGLLLYGPPGCGKTFLARSVASELGAGFLHLSLADVLGLWLGVSEQNVPGVFERARRQAPCLVFVDELDALSRARGQLSGATLRGVVDQLIRELDLVTAANDGVFVLAATNQPWDVDSELRRPGRLDRSLLVPPPDEEARATILRAHLADRPVAGVDHSRMARLTDGYSGSDLALVCATAAQAVLAEQMFRGVARPIGTADLEAAIRDVRPSTRPWLETARSVALLAGSGGEYHELLAYLRERRLA